MKVNVPRFDGGLKRRGSSTMARQERYDLGPLADFMAEDILSTPGRHLVEEVTEDCGDPEAFASAFEQIVSRWRRFFLPFRGNITYSGSAGGEATEATCRMKILVVGHYVLIREAPRGVLIEELGGDITVLEAADSR